MLLLLLAAVALVGFAVRLAPTFGPRSHSAIPILEPDSIYHLVRVEATVAQFPSVPMRNPREEFPEGSTYESPPLYPLVLATGAKVASLLPGPQPEGMRRCLAFWGPITGAFSCAAFFVFAGLFLSSPYWRALAGLLFAILPIGINYSSWGSIDYQAWIVGWTLLLYWAVLRGRDRFAVVALVILFGTWQASVFQAGILLIGIAAGVVCRKEAGPLERLAKLFLATGCLHVPMAAWADFGGGGKLSPAFYGPGTVLMILSLAALAWAAARRSWLWALVSLAVVSPVLSTVWRGVVVLYRNPIPFLGTVTESAPLFRIGGDWNLRAPLYLLTPPVLLSPIVLGWLILRWRRDFRSFLTPEICFLLTGFVVAGSAGLAQARHSEQWAPFAVVVLVLGASSLPVGRTIAAALLLAGAFPVVGATKPRPVRGDYRVLEESLAFWKGATAGVGGPAGHAVLAGWEYGLFLEEYAGQTISIDARGPMSTPDWRWVADLFLAEEEGEALEIIHQKGIRWIVVRDHYPMFQTYIAWGGKARSDYYVDDDRGARPTPRLLRTVGFRLAELLGVARPGAETKLDGLGHFRLRWLSSAPPPDRAHLHPWWFKIYEVVPGVTLRAKAPVRIEGTLLLPNGAAIRYERDADSFPDGSYRLTIPYSSAELHDARILAGGKTIPFEASVEEVGLGATIDLDGQEATAGQLRPVRR